MTYSYQAVAHTFSLHIVNCDQTSVMQKRPIYMQIIDIQVDRLWQCRAATRCWFIDETPALNRYSRVSRLAFYPSIDRALPAVFRMSTAAGLTRTAYTMPIFFGRGFFVGERFGWQLISSGEKKSKVCIVVHRDIACTFLCTRFIWRCVLGCYMSVYSFSPPDCQKRACWLYIGWSDVTESMVTIRRHFVGITRHNALS